MTVTMKVTAIVLFAGFLTAPERPIAQGKGDVDLRAAMETETVKGDLNAAIKQYQAVVDRVSKTDRATAATALIRMAECYQKLGDAQSRKVYERVVGEFGDQLAALNTARARLAGLSGETTARTVSPRLVSQDGYIDRISRDGRFGLVSYNADLGVRNMATGEVKWLQLHQHLDSPVLSPDGSQIAYAYFPDPHMTWLNVVANEVGAKPRVLINNSEIDYLLPAAWSLDGKSILAGVRRRDRTWQLGWVSATTGAITVLRSLDWRFQEDGFDLSPDGRFVAYAALSTNPGKPRPSRAEAPDTYIYVVPSNGEGTESVVVKMAGNNIYPLWTPDGAHVVFRSDRTAGTLGLWSVPVQNGRATGAPELIRQNVGQMTPIGITRSGTLYYDEDSGPNYGVSILALTPSNPGDSPATVASIEGVVNAGWSPDGKSLALRGFSRRDGKPYWDLIIHSLETGEERTFSVGDVGGLGPDAPIWLHDGKGLLVPIFTWANTAPFRQIWQRLDLSTGTFSEIVPLNANELRLGAALSSDDRILYFSRRRISEESFSDGIVAFDLITRHEREVVSLPTGPMRPENPASAQASPGIHRLFLSADDRTLLYSRTDAAGSEHIFRVGVNGGNAREIYGAPPGDSFNSLQRRLSFELLGWSTDGRSVLLTQDSQLMRVPAEGGGSETTGTKLPAGGRIPPPVPFLFLSPDGTRLAVGDAFASQSRVWAIDNISALSTAVKR